MGVTVSRPVPGAKGLEQEFDGVSLDLRNPEETKTRTWR
jgi:hypothetical protein